MRGRIQKKASLCSGRPLLWSWMVTLEAVHCGSTLALVLFLHPATGVTLITLPTFTPATRTSDA